MKNRIFWVLAIFVCLFSSCEKDVFVNGPTTTREHMLDGYKYDLIYIDNNIEAYIGNKPSNSVSISTNESVHDYIDVYTSRNSLYIKLKHNVNFNKDVRIVASIPANRVSEININNNSKLLVDAYSSVFFDDIAIVKLNGESTFDGNIKSQKVVMLINGESAIYAGINAESVEFNINGESVFEGDIVAKSLKIEATNYSNIALSGSTRYCEMEQINGSEFYGKNFFSNELKAKFNGSSKGIINVRNNLDCILKGSSVLKYIGYPLIYKDISEGSILERIY